MKRFPAALVLTGLLAAVASAAPAPIEVRTARLARGDITRYAALPGTLRANQQATLCAKVGGYLTALAVDRGDAVAAGQELGRIEAPELLADRTRLQAEVRVAEAACTRMEEAVGKAPDLVMPQAVDEARGRLAIARAELERVDTLLRYTTLIAPFAGLVTARFVDPGAYVPAATAPVVTLADFRVIRAQVPVPEVEAALVRTGQPVRVSLDSLGGRAVEGTVSRLAFALDEATRTMLVEADLPNEDLSLRPGMFATVRIGLERHADALLLPAGALVMEKANAFAFVAEGGKAKKTPLKIGFNDGARVEVLSGLSGSEAVILAGKTALADGAAVTVVEGS